MVGLVRIATKVIQGFIYLKLNYLSSGAPISRVSDLIKKTTNAQRRTPRSWPPFEAPKSKFFWRRCHVQILAFVVKLDFRIRIIKGSLKSILSNRDL